MNSKGNGAFTFFGFLWRSVVFLLGIVLISWLLSLLMAPPRTGSAHNPIHNPNPGSDPRLRDRDTTIVADTLSRPIPPELRDTSLVRDWVDSIPGVRELPNPRENIIPPVDTNKVVPSPENPRVRVVADELVVFFNSKDLKRDMASFARQFKSLYPQAGYSILYYNPAAGTMLLRVPEDKLKEALDEIPRKITDIKYRVTTNEILSETASIPSDPDFAEQDYKRYFDLIQAFEAWEITRGVSEVKVAIIDSYFDLTNPEIGQRYVDRIHIPSKTVNVLPFSEKPTLDNFSYLCHGSHVAGIAIGGQNNKLGVSGIAPECSWIPVALGDQLTSFNVIEGILYAIYHGADVINLSLGRGYGPDAQSIPLPDQIQIATTTDLRGEELWAWIYEVADEHNCVICTAAGNESILMGMDPKNRSDKIIKVEAVDGNGYMAEFTNFGKAKDGLNYSTVSAPGVNIRSATDPRTGPFWRFISILAGEEYNFSEDGFQDMGGTSMASPMVAGAVALLKSKNKDLSVDDIIKILCMTGKQKDPSGKIGPTIQIRDALDATPTGDRLNFDDLMNNHNLLLGKWKSTHEMSIVKKSGEKVDDMWTYFIFSSTEEGKIRLSTINTRKDYEGPVAVRWGGSTVTFIELTDAVAPDGDKVSKNEHICYPNGDRLLEVSCLSEGVEQFRYMLEKVN